MVLAVVRLVAGVDGHVGVHKEVRTRRIPHQIHGIRLEKRLARDRCLQVRVLVDAYKGRGALGQKKKQQKTNQAVVQMSFAPLAIMKCFGKSVSFIKKEIAIEGG
jgi:hypothetical protein